MAPERDAHTGAVPTFRREERPYAALMGAFAGLLLAGARSGRAAPPASLVDVACLGVASHDVARIISRDRIAVFLRAPFTLDEAAQFPRGHGMRRAVGELLTCESCLSLWVALAFAAGFARVPRGTRFVASVFAGHALARAPGLVARLLPR